MVYGFQVSSLRSLFLKRAENMTETQKDCFGDLDKVFPMGTEGLREVPPICFECAKKKACLQTALTTKKGLALRSEIADRAPVKGIVGRLKRWSEKKTLTQLTKHKEGENK
jgi:hypothetical protein